MLVNIVHQEISIVLQNQSQPCCFYPLLLISNEQIMRNVATLQQVQIIPLEKTAVINYHGSGCIYVFIRRKGRLISLPKIPSYCTGYIYAFILLKGVRETTQYKDERQNDSGSENKRHI